MSNSQLSIVLAFFAVLALLLFGLATLAVALARWACSLRPCVTYAPGLAVAAIVMAVGIYGCTLGFARFRVNRVVLSFPDLPAAFDGYRIIHITDAHLGSFAGGHQGLLGEAVDSILALRPDLVVFTGDIQNHAPDELRPFVGQLSRLRAADGVYAVLGNHDYGYPHTASSPRLVRRIEEEAGWRVLVNEHVAISRDSAHIVLAGMDNDGDGRHFPRRGDIRRTLAGVQATDFVIMLEHDPTSWRRNILANSHVQLTLSGHTHAMQFGIGGWSPSKWFYKEWYGLYTDDKPSPRRLFVSCGVGGVVPFRFGMPREAVLIELRCR